MKSSVFRALTLLVTAGLSCSDGGSAGPDDEQLLAGLELTAEITPLEGGTSAFLTGMVLAGKVSLVNTTTASIERHVHSGCPVRIRLFKPNADTPSYDQSVFPCDLTTIVPLTIGSGERKTLSTGTTVPYEVQADSVPAGVYRATILLRIAGENPIELEAGDYRLPNCPTPTTCVFVGPPTTAASAGRE